MIWNILCWFYAFYDDFSRISMILMILRRFFKWFFYRSSLIWWWFESFIIDLKMIDAFYDDFLVDFIDYLNHSWLINSDLDDLNHLLLILRFLSWFYKDFDDFDDLEIIFLMIFIVLHWFDDDLNHLSLI